MATNDSYATAPPEATAVGTVACVNENGIKFHGAENWVNVSKFAVGVVMPKKGDIVSVTFDRQGFIRAIGPADDSAATRTRDEGRGSRGEGKAPKASGAPAGIEGRDRTITRLAVLKAAAEFSASKPNASSADVLKIASAWERWVLREETGDRRQDTGETELIDAF